jgi:hypothetical protein
MKLSEWMTEELDGHGMFDVAYVEGKLLELTGKHFKLPTFSAGAARSEVGKHPKGPEWVNPKLPDHLKMCAGYQVANIVVGELLGKDPAPYISGRGSHFRACVAALKEAGL